MTRPPRHEDTKFHKENAIETEPSWEKYFPREFTDGKFGYDLEKVIAFAFELTLADIYAAQTKKM